MEELIISRSGHVATVCLNRPPHNFFDSGLLRAIADAIAAAEADTEVRAILLSARGRSFCAGVNFASASTDRESPQAIYSQAERIFDRSKPLVAAVGGPAVGGGFGLALAADFRVVSESARFHANFASLGLHPGFALTATLPSLLGNHGALDLLLTARRVTGQEALAIGLADRLVPDEQLAEEAMATAQTLAANAPLALLSIFKAVPRVDKAAARVAMASELAEQSKLFNTRDFREGVSAAAARRTPQFTGR